MNITPAKVLKVRTTLVTIAATWDADDGTGDPFIGFPYQWNVVLAVTPQTHSSYSTPIPYAYDGRSILVDDWLSNATGGFAWKIVSITSQSATTVTVVVEDVDRFNTFSASGQNGDGTPQTFIDGFVFQCADDGLPILSPVIENVLTTQWQTDLISRFRAHDFLRSHYRVNQVSHGFSVGNLITLTNSGYAKAATGNVIIGQVNSINIPGDGYFTYLPVGRVIGNLPTLPGNPGDLIYLDTGNSGGFTATIPANHRDAVYIKINSTTAVLINRGDKTVAYADMPSQVQNLPFVAQISTPTDGQVIWTLPCIASYTLPVNFSGSAGYANTTSTGSAVFTVGKIVSGSPSTIGTITFAASQRTPTFVAASATTMNVGDILTLTAPSTADATLADIGIILLAQKT